MSHAARSRRHTPKKRRWILLLPIILFAILHDSLFVVSWCFPNGDPAKTVATFRQLYALAYPDSELTQRHLDLIVGADSPEQAEDLLLQWEKAIEQTTIISRQASASLRDRGQEWLHSHPNIAVLTKTLEERDTRLRQLGHALMINKALKKNSDTTQEITQTITDVIYVRGDLISALVYRFQRETCRVGASDNEMHEYH